jgi:sulfonate transport system ATP-binding protein
VEEAVFLGDRVVVMQPSPGRIRRTVDVDLPHPRNRSDPAFIRLRDDVLSDFIDSGAEARPPTQPPQPPHKPQGGLPVPGLPAGLQLAW